MLCCLYPSCFWGLAVLSREHLLRWWGTGNHVCGGHKPQWEPRAFEWVPVGCCASPCPQWNLLSLQKETLPSTRLAALPPAFSTRILPAQATEYKFAFIQVPQDVSPRRSLLMPTSLKSELEPP